MPMLSAVLLGAEAEPMRPASAAKGGALLWLHGVGRAFDHFYLTLIEQRTRCERVPHDSLRSGSNRPAASNASRGKPPPQATGRL